MSQSSERDAKNFRRRITVSCVQCRRRKIKCDRTQPCQACSARGLVDECVFELDESRRQAVAMSDEVTRLRKENEALKRKAEHIVPKRPESELPDISLRGTAGLQLTRGAAKLQRSAVQLSELQAPMLETFIDNHSYGAGRRTYGWLRRIGSSVREDMPLLGDAMRASALMYCATEQNRLDLRMHGLELYGKVLARLQSQINDPVGAMQSETLFTTMLIALHELLVLKNPMTWLLHIDGVGRLLQFRGPQRHVSGLENFTFRFYRMFGISLNIFYRKPCFLATQPWRTWPWALAWPSKDMYDLLVDIIADAPFMFALADEIKSLERDEDPSAEAKKRELAFQIAQFSGGLDKWVRDWVVTYPGGGHPDLILPVERQQPVDPGEWSSEGTGPADIGLAEALTIYYAARLLFLRVDPSVDMLEKSKVMELVSCICSTVEFQLERETEFFGAFSLLFPLRIAYFTPFDDAPLRKRVGVLLGVLVHQFSIRFAGFIISSMPGFAGQLSLQDLQAGSNKQLSPLGGSQTPGESRTEEESDN